MSVKRKQHIRPLLIFAVFMFGFSFALIPLFNTFCKVTGLNGKPTNMRVSSELKIDTSRLIKAQLIASRDSKILAEFEPQHKMFKLHPGEFVQTNFRVKNLSDKPMMIQAISSISPGQTAQYVKKVVCFCFQVQELKANQEMIFPLKFTVDPKIPKRYQTISLSYTLFDVTPS